MDGPNYRIVFRPLRDDVPVMLRLRRFLKLALRAFNLRCVSVEELPADSQKDETQGKPLA